jgi:hypothetical protein
VKANRALAHVRFYILDCGNKALDGLVVQFQDVKSQTLG